MVEGHYNYKIRKMHVYSWKFQLNFNSNHTQKFTTPPVKSPILWTNNKKLKKNKFEKSKTKHNYLKISLENLLELKTFTWHVKNKTVLVFYGYMILVTSPCFPYVKCVILFWWQPVRKLFSVIEATILIASTIRGYPF